MNFSIFNRFYIYVKFDREDTQLFELGSFFQKKGNRCPQKQKASLY